MKAITICQPYAHLIAIGEKRIENRAWPTRYRGPLAIHAGKSRAWLSDGDEARYQAMAFGAVICTVELVDCQLVEDLKGAWAEHEHANGPWCWLFARQVHRLDVPIPAVGKQGLWEFTEVR